MRCSSIQAVVVALAGALPLAGCSASSPRVSCSGDAAHLELARESGKCFTVDLYPHRGARIDWADRGLLQVMGGPQGGTPHVELAGDVVTLQYHGLSDAQAAPLIRWDGLTQRVAFGAEAVDFSKPPLGWHLRWDEAKRAWTPATEQP
jgi:hypothetical protein